MSEIRKVAWLHVVERRLLCVRHLNGRKFYLPGGRHDGGTARATLRREIEAQVGISLDDSQIVFADQLSAPSDEDPAVTVSIAVFTAHASEDPVARGEIAEIAFLGSDDTARASTLTQLILARLETLDVID